MSLCSDPAKEPATFFLTTAEFNYELLYASPESLVDPTTHTHAPYIFMTLRIGTDGVTGFSLQEAHPLITAVVRINRLD